MTQRDQGGESAPIAAMIEAKERIRYEVLTASYALSQGSELRFFRLSELAAATKRTAAEVKDAFDYLRGEGLLVPRALGGVCGITHAGVVEYERTINAPAEPTEHFRVTVIQNVTQHFHASVGTVQTGDRATTNLAAQTPPEPGDPVIDDPPPAPKE